MWELEWCVCVPMFCELSKGRGPLLVVPVFSVITIIDCFFIIFKNGKELFSKTFTLFDWIILLMRL